MKKVKVIINFARFTVANLIEFARNTVIKMTGNASFPTPDVVLSQITGSANNLEAKFNAAQGGGKQQTAEMHQARKALEDLLHKQVLYIERIAGGNEAAILSSGFTPTKQPQPSLRPDFKVSNGIMEGEVILKHKAVKGARSWVWQCCPDPLNTNQWVQIGISTQTTFTVKELEQGKKYWFRTAYITSAGQSEWCEPFIKIVI
jgi:hypothetical protein